MSSIRTPQEIALMRTSGTICAQALKETLEAVKAGVTTRALDQIAEASILRQGGEISFRTVENYPYTTCITVNDEVVHGIPSDYKLKANDIVSVDIGALYQGWHSDLAESVIVDGEKLDQQRIDFLQIGKHALIEAIAQAKAGNRVGDISHAMQAIVEGADFACVRALTGHGVGKELHEEPLIPCFGKPHKGVELKAGMTVAIEVIYNMGSSDVQWKNNDGWTIASADGSLAGLFERTILITNSEPEILTPIDTLLGE